MFFWAFNCAVKTNLLIKREREREREAMKHSAVGIYKTEGQVDAKSVCCLLGRIETRNNLTFM